MADGTNTELADALQRYPTQSDIDTAARRLRGMPDGERKLIAELMIPLEALLMAYPEIDAKPLGLTGAIWEAIRNAMPAVRALVLHERKEPKP